MKYKVKASFFRCWVLIVHIGGVIDGNIDFGAVIVLVDDHDVFVVHLLVIIKLLFWTIIIAFVAILTEERLNISVNWAVKVVDVYLVVFFKFVWVDKLWRNLTLLVQPMAKEDWIKRLLWDAVADGGRGDDEALFTGDFALNIYETGTGFVVPGVEVVAVFFVDSSCVTLFLALCGDNCEAVCIPLLSRVDIGHVDVGLW